MELYQDIFKKCLSLYSANIAEIALNITLCKTIPEEEIQSEIDPSTKSVKTPSCFMPT